WARGRERLRAASVVPGAANSIGPRHLERKKPPDPARDDTLELRGDPLAEQDEGPRGRALIASRQRYPERRGVLPTQIPGRGGRCVRHAGRSLDREGGSASLLEGN